MQYRLRRGRDDVHGLSLLCDGQLFRAVLLLPLRRGFRPPVLTLWGQSGAAMRPVSRDVVNVHGADVDAGHKLPVRTMWRGQKHPEKIRDAFRARLGLLRLVHAIEDRVPDVHARDAQ